MGWRGSTTTDHVLLVIATIGGGTASAIWEATKLRDWQAAWRQENDVRWDAKKREPVGLSIQNVRTRLSRLEGSTHGWNRVRVVRAEGEQGSWWHVANPEELRKAMEPPAELVRRATDDAAELGLEVEFSVELEESTGMWEGIVVVHTARGRLVGIALAPGQEEWVAALECVGL